MGCVITTDDSSTLPKWGNDSADSASAPCGVPLSCYTPAVSCPGCPLVEMTQTKPLPTAVTNSSLQTITVPHLHPEWQLLQSPLNHIISRWLSEISVPFSIKSITGDDGDCVTCHREWPAAVRSASPQPALSLNCWLRALLFFSQTVRMMEEFRQMPHECPLHWCVHTEAI